MESIIPNGPSDDDPRKNIHLVKWEGDSHDENTWEMYANISECSMNMLGDYYGMNPLIERDRCYSN
jgi:hypothetical protein